MNQYLSISKVAELLNTTAHNIRYYEKEELINPMRSEKNYRMFSFKEIEVLSLILKLRSIDISINEIKSLRKPYEPEKFIDLLHEKLSEIELEIKRLKEVKTEMGKIIKGYDSRTLGFIKRTIPKRRIVPVKCCAYSEDLNENEIHEFITSMSYEISKDDPVDIICILDPKSITYYLEVNETYHKEDVIEVPKGKYLCYRFKAENDDAFYLAYDEFMKHIKENKIKTGDTLYLSEESIQDLYYKDMHQPVHEYQIKLK